MNESPSTVLVVEDERRLADLFAEWLSEEYDVITAYDGEQALDYLDAPIDAAILDRRMPGLSGDDVLNEIRARGIECPVAMVTAVDPDFDIVEMGFDDYIVKPVRRSDLLSLLDNLFQSRQYEDAVQRYYQLSSKKAALEAAKSKMELERSDEYTTLVKQCKRAKAEADAEISSLANSREFTELF